MNKFNIREDSVIKPIPIDFLSDYKLDGELSDRDIGAKVKRSFSKFISDTNLIMAMFDSKVECPIDENKRFYNWFLAKPNIFYHAHVDLAKNNCRAGIALGHQEGIYTIIDLAYAIDPKEQAGGEIDFEDVRNIFKSLDNRGFQYEITFDSWQSFDSLQQFQKTGIIAELLSVDRDIQAYTAYRRAIYDREIKTYYNQLLYDETKNLDRIDFTKVDHPKGFTKDLSDSVAAVTFKCREESFRELKDGAVV